MRKLIDEIGNQYGKLLVVERAQSPNSDTAAYWLCQCDCGNTTIQRGHDLRRGSVKTCGCSGSGPKPKNEMGGRYGRLTVLERAGTNSNKCITWLCQCDCGNTVIIAGTNLRRGSTHSCGCLMIEKNRKQQLLPPGIAARNEIFGKYQRDAATRGFAWYLSEEEFISLTSQDCHYCGCPPSKEYITPGGGWKYNGLDRIDNAKGYIPDNVVPCCTCCNLMKRDLKREEFMAQIKNIAHHQGWL